MRTARIVRSALAQVCCAALMCQTALAGMASSAWSDLWHTPDQQGQALLEAGKPAQAAERFHDRRLRAYADLEAGRYTAAAKLLAPFKDVTSDYNRGNALARSGALPAALAAYDAALKQSPHDRDIRHNRDLVERELRKQLRSGPSRGSRRGGPGQPGSSSTRPQAGRGGQHGSGKPSTGGGRHDGKGGSSGRGARAGQSASAGPAKRGAGRPGASASPGSGQAGSSASGRSASPNAPTPGAGSSPDSASQARRDAAFAAGLERSGGADRQGSAAGASAQPDAGRAPAAARAQAGGPGLKRKPASEQTLALDQWLRQIPDSPAGLLRRKFMIQYMLKHPDASGGEPQ